MMRHANMRLAPLALFLAIALISGGCASAREEPLFLAPDFQRHEIRSIALAPVTFDQRYDPPYGIDLAREIESRAAAVLEGKGYRVSRPASQGGDVSEAVMSIHVDFLFITETYDDIVPPPVIDIEAAGRLVSLSTGEVLWRDRGVGKVGGAGGGRIERPVSARLLALTLLVENLFDSLPPGRH